MKEEFLHYVWKHKLLSTHELCSTENQSLYIINYGQFNVNSGPDFLNARIKIDEIEWYGHVEIHVNASDWYVHNHENDPAYETVILHAVWNNDVAIYDKGNLIIPTLILKPITSKVLLQNYQKFNLLPRTWIPCENQLGNIPSFVLSNWMERLFFERLEKKHNIIGALLAKNKANYEATLFQLLATNFGLKINAPAFYCFANSFDFYVIKKVQHNKTKLSALFFGQAGFLEEEFEDVFYNELKSTYSYLKHVFNLKPIANQQFQFFKIRPTNFPTIRIAQLSALYFKYKKLFSQIMDLEHVQETYKLFSIKLPKYWETHYSFQTESKKSYKKLTKPFIDLLLINTIIPLQFYYAKRQKVNHDASSLKMIKAIQPEKNSTLLKFSKCGVIAKNALESQALLELKNEYCNHKKCLQCAIGNHLLQRNANKGS